MDDVHWASEVVDRMAMSIADQVATDLQAKFAKMFAGYRAGVSDRIRDMTVRINECDEENGEKFNAEDFKADLVEIRAELVDLQDGVDDNTGIWTPEVKDEVMKKIAERLATRPSETYRPGR